MDLETFRTQLVDAINGSLDNTNNELIEPLHNALEDLSRSPFFVPAAIHILQNPQTSSRVFNFCLILLNDLAQQTGSLEPEIGVDLVHQLINLLALPTITFSDKQKIKKTLTTAISVPHSDPSNLAVARMREELTSLIRVVNFAPDSPQMQDPDQIQTLLFAISALVSSSSNVVHVLRVESIIPCVKSLFDLTIRPALSALTTERYNLSQIGTPAVQGECEVLLNRIETYVSIVKTILKREKTFGNIRKRIGILNREFFGVLLGLLPLQIGNLNANSGNLVFNPTSFEPLNAKLNTIQARVLFSLMLIYKRMGFGETGAGASDDRPAHRSKKAAPKKILTGEEYQPVVSFIVEALVGHMGTAKPGKSAGEKRILLSIQSSCLAFLASTCRNMAFSELFYAKKMEIIQHIVLPGMVYRDDELESFEDNPGEFSRTLSDLMTHRKSKSPKVNLIRLIDSMCSSVPGALSAIADHAFALAEIALTGCSTAADLARITSAYPSIAESVATPFFQQSTPDQKLQTSLLTLAATRLQILGREDLKGRLQSFVLTHNASLANPSLPPLLKALYINLVMLSPHKILGISKKDGQFVARVVELLRWVLQEIRANDGTSRVAGDALFRYLAKKKSVEIFGQIFKHFVEFFESVLRSGMSTAYFNLAEAFFKRFGHLFNDCLPQFEQFMGLISRAIDQAVNQGDGNLANKLLELIQTLAHHEQLAINAFGVFDAALAQTTPVFGVAQPQLHSTLLETFITLMDSSKRPTQQADVILSIAPHIHEVNNFRYGELFWFLNTLMKYGSASFDSQRVEVVLGIINSTLTQGSGEHRQYDHATALLLLQATIQYCHSVFTAEQAAAVVQIFRVFQDSAFAMDMNGPDSDAAFLADKVLCVYFSAILYLPDQNLGSLAELTLASSIGQLVLDHYSIFLSAYETRLMIQGMCRLAGFLWASGHPQVRQLFDHILNFLLAYLKVRQLKAFLQIGRSKTLKKLAGEYIERHELDLHKAKSMLPELPKHFRIPKFEGEEEEDLGTGIRIEEIMEAQVNTNSEKESVLNRFDFPAKRVDEFQMFRKMIDGVAARSGGLEYIKEFRMNSPLGGHLEEVARDVRYVNVATGKGQEDFRVRKILRLA